MIAPQVKNKQILANEWNNICNTAANNPVLFINETANKI